MHKHGWMPTLWLLLALMPGAIARSTAASPPPNPAAAEIRALWSALDAAWNARDAAAMSRLFTAQASFVFVDRDERLDGRAVIHAHFAQRFPDFSPQLRHVTEIRAVRALGTATQLVDGTVEVVRVGSDDATGVTVLRRFAIFAVMVHAHKGWRIDALRVYALPLPVPDPQDAGRRHDPGNRADGTVRTAVRSRP